MGGVELRRKVGCNQGRGFGPDVPAPDPADAEQAVDPVAGFGGDDRAKPWCPSRDRKRHAVTNGDEPIWAVDDDGHEIPAGSGADEGVAGSGGKGAGSRKCNHGVGIGGGWCGAPDLYG